MKRLAWVLGALALLLVAALAAAAWLLDAEALRAPLARAASDALGREVKLGAMRVALLPLPSVEVRELSVAGAAKGDPPFAEIEALRLRVALWPLLAGQVIVRALELERPRIAVPLDRDGAPVLPGPRAAGSGSSAPDARTEETGSSGLPALAVQRIALRDGELRVGDWTARALDADGTLGLDGAGRLQLETDLAGLAQARGAKLDADFRLAGQSVSALDAELSVDELSYASGGTELRGPASGAAQLGGPWRLDLSRAALRVPGSIDKRPGVPLVLSGQLGKELGAAALAEVLLELGRAKLVLAPDPERGRISASGKLAIADLEGVLDPALPLRGGGVEIEGLGAVLAETRLFGRAILDRLLIAGPKSPIEITGIAIARGHQILLQDAVALVGGERVALSGTYDLDTGTARVQSSTQGAKLGALVGALADGVPLEGTLASNAGVELAGGLETLRGQGRIDIRPGQIRGFSLLRQVLGELAALPALVAAAKGRDLSRFEQESFEELSADFRIEGGRLSTENLLLRYADGLAQLRGSVGLVDRALDLRGRLELSREVDAELGKTKGAPTVIPIAHIAGTLDAPRVQLDRETLAQLALTYAGRDRVREKLEEKLGSEGASAVEDILDQVLGGEKKP
jgi:hypothetical protein